MSIERKIIIFGAGITGLSAGWKLAEAGFRVKVIDKNDYLGGMASTFQHDDCSLDYGPHKIFTVLDNVMAEINELFRDDPLLAIKKKSRIRLRGRYLNFPLGIKDIFLGLGFFTGLRCGFGYAASIAGNLLFKPKKISYEDWAVNSFGRPIYDLVLGPYANKIWGDPRTLSKELAESRIAAPNLAEMIKQIIFGKKTKSPVINADVFYYPRKGIIDLSAKMAERIKKHGGEVRLGRDIKEMNADTSGRIDQLSFSDGSRESLGPGDAVISTIPIPVLMSLLKRHIDERAVSAAGKLRTRKLVLLYLVLKRDRLGDDNWLFFPEKRYMFNRVFEQKVFNEGMVPRGKTVICLEMTCDDGDSLWTSNDRAVYSMALPQLREAGLAGDEVIGYFTKRFSSGYPVYDIGYKENLDAALSSLEGLPNLYSVGRQGGFSYTGMADCMDIGFSTADFIITGKNKQDQWKDYRSRFYNYVVVD